MDSGRQKVARIFQGLTSRIALSFFGVSVLILAIATLLNLYFNYRSQRNAIANEQLYIVREAASQVRGFVGDKLDALRDVSLFSGIGSSDAQRSALALDKLLGHDQSFRRVAFFDESGREFAQSSRLSQFTTKSAITEEQYNEIAKLKEGERYISPVYIDSVTNEPLVVLAVPIVGSLNEIQGVLTAEVNLKFMWDLVGSMHVGQRGLAYVVDREGNLLAFGDSSRALASEKVANLQEVSQFMSDNNNKDADNPAEISTGINGAYVLSTYEELSAPDWAVIVELPVSEAFAPLVRLLQLSGIVLLIGLLVAVFSSIRLSRKIAKPIIILRDTAIQMSQGKLSVRTNFHHNDEIGQLGRAFNDMAQKIENSFLGLTAEKEKIETLIESMGDGVLATDKAGRVVLWNEAARAITGWSKEEAVGRPFREVLRLIREKDRQANDQFIQQAMDTKITRSMENHTLLIRKDGSELPVGDSAAPILGLSGSAEGVIVVFRDMTRERELDRAKEEFVSIASHQLRTPLTAVKGYTGMLLDGDAGPLTAKQVEYLSEVKNGNDRMIDLVTALLNTSRVDLGVFAIDPKPTNLTEISETLIKELKFDIQYKGLSIKADYDPNIPTINADPKLLRIVIQNLLTNAVKYTPAGGNIVISIKKSENEILIDVADTGCGIPKDVQNKIFGKMFRADNARQRDPGGTGLGLYVAKAIVEESGGRISFISEENKGTTFSVRLPMAGMKKREGSKSLQ